MGDNTVGSYPQNPPRNTNKRTEFGRFGCTVYGYPSSGGALIKEADLVDMQFLQLDRFRPVQRSSDPIKEDDFFSRMRKVGATWWADEQESIGVELGMREQTEMESRQSVLGWPDEW